MSQSQFAAVDSDHNARSDGNEIEVESPDDVQRLLNVVDDEDCIDIMDATAETSLSATEIADTCDLPLSTTYRKLDRLNAAGLLEQGTRLRRSGKHTSEYARRIGELQMSVNLVDGFELTATLHEARPAKANVQFGVGR
jgi:DNA-binding transcriptional ArsR family regulator